MADRIMFIGWNRPARGREERALEVFEESLGLYGRMQQEGAIESFDVVLLDPMPGLGGWIALHGTASQLDAVREDERFRRTMTDAEMAVDDMRVVTGVTGTGVERNMTMYREAVARVPQAH